MLLVEMRVVTGTKDAEHIIPPAMVIPTSLVMVIYSQQPKINNRHWKILRRMKECSVRRMVGKRLIVVLM